MSTIIENLLALGNVGLTVYSPDAHASRLLTRLDAFVRSHSGLRPIHRRWFSHNAGSIERFYEPVVANNVPHWHLVSKLFVSGPSLLTLWEGDEAIARLTRLKGRSHPAVAGAGTLRAGFWIDNSVCNLIHVSDSIVDVVRELAAIDALHVLKGRPEPVEPLVSITARESALVSHSGTLAFARFLYALELACRPQHVPPPALLEEDDARNNFENLRRYLESSKEGLTPRGTELVRMFFDGDQQLEQCVRDACVAAPWDEFLISCSLSGMACWTGKARLYDAVRRLCDCLKGVEPWFISGSSALYLHGFPCVPADLDVTCSRSSLERIASMFGLTIKENERAFGSYASANYRVEGWDVEFSEFSRFRGRHRFEIDASMMARAGNLLPIMPIEDVVVELIAMNRQNGKQDVARARAVFQRLRARFDMAYLSHRIAQTKVDGSVFETA